jgi:hypothetical protein
MDHPADILRWNLDQEISDSCGQTECFVESAGIEPVDDSVVKIRAVR